MSDPIDCISNDVKVPAVKGTHNADGIGVYGKSGKGAGLYGESDKLHGIFGMCHNEHGAGVFGTNSEYYGMGVQGINELGDGVNGSGRRGVVGTSKTYQGVYGHSTQNAGVVGESDQQHGVFGLSHTLNGAGVYGTSDVAGGFGLQGLSDQGIGVYGQSKNVAGRFEGNVEVTTKLFINGMDVFSEIEKLQNSVYTDLANEIQKLQTMVSHMTVKGAIMPLPFKRPTIDVHGKPFNREQGIAEVTVSGDGYDSFRTINVHPLLYSARNGAAEELGPYIVNPPFDGFKDGHFSVSLQIRCEYPDSITFRAEQGFQDFNDTSGLLYSVNYLLNVSSIPA